MTKLVTQEPFDLNPGANRGECTCTRTPQNPLPVLIVMGDPLCQQAMAALVERDQRFTLAGAASFAMSRQVALVDARRLPRGWSRLLQASNVEGCVILHQPGISTSHLIRSPEGIRQVNITWDAAWEGVAEALEKVAEQPERNSDPVGHDNQTQSLLRLQSVEIMRSLTQREREVLRLIAEGCSVRQAAAALHLAESTIDNHKSRLMKKVGVRKSIDLARFAYRAGLANP